MGDRRRTALSVVPAVRPAWEALLRLIYPPRCAGCGTAMADARDPLCHRCLVRLDRADAAELDALLARLPDADRVLRDAFALWIFDAGGTVQRVQHLLKYGNRPAVGLALGRLMGTAYRGTPAPLPDLVLPVPLHRTRLYERGYNQSAVLARGLGRTLDVPTSEDLLVRRRATRSQTRLSRQRRWDNVAGAFTLRRPDAVPGRRILVVDDVLTTGATLVAAATVLHRAGAASVHAATLALARG